MSVELRLELEDSRDSEGARGGFYRYRLKYDGAHQKHEMWIDHSPDDDETVFRYTLKTAAGALQEDRSLLLPVDAGGRRREKFDDLGPPIVVVPLGETVGSWVVPCDWHGPLRWQNNQPVGRKTRRGFIVIPGVYIPHAAGQDPDEVFGVDIPTGNGGGGEPVDYEQLRAIIREELDDYTGRLRPHIMQKTEEAIERAGVLTLNVDMNAYYGKFNQYDRDRAYEAVKAYHEPAGDE
jgi:hypothetical protein